MLRQLVSLIVTVTLLIVFVTGTAGADGTLKAIFKYKDSNGMEQPLPHAYLYLRNAAVSPPMEKNFTPADYIFGPTDSSGLLNAIVPEGKYFVRITGRGSLEARPLGPPEPGDHSWAPITPITIGTDTVTDLGIQYAAHFGVPPIQFSGTIKNYSGQPLAGQYVVAQSMPCTRGECEKVYPAQQRTSADGTYTILLRIPGRYWIAVTDELGSGIWANMVGPIEVKEGDIITMADIVSY
jgi:hypothetical protein